MVMQHNVLVRLSLSPSLSPSLRPAENSAMDLSLTPGAVTLRPEAIQRVARRTSARLLQVAETGGEKGHSSHSAKDSANAETDWGMLGTNCILGDWSPLPMSSGFSFSLGEKESAPFKVSTSSPHAGRCREQPH